MVSHLTPADCPRLVVKIGSSLLVDPSGMVRQDWLQTVVDDIADRRAAGQQIIIVSSGAIALANSTPYGLASYLFTRSLKTATLASEAIHAGMVGVNELAIASAEMPFGGVGASGMGREGGSLGIRDYLEAKFIKTRL